MIPLLLYVLLIVSRNVSLIFGHIIKTPSTTTESSGRSIKPVVNVRFPSDVTSGDNVTLFCDYDDRGRGLYSVRWYFNGEEVFRYKESRSKPSKEVFPAALKDKKFSIDLNSSSRDSLRVVNIRTAGQFKCEVTEYKTFTSTSVGDRLNVTRIEDANSGRTLLVDQLMLLFFTLSSLMIHLDCR